MKKDRLLKIISRNSYLYDHNNNERTEHNALCILHLCLCGLPESTKKQTSTVSVDVPEGLYAGSSHLLKQYGLSVSDYVWLMLVAVAKFGPKVFTADFRKKLKEQSEK